MQDLPPAVPAALSAALVALLVTRAIERWGGRVGGVLGTAPTTIVPASIGLFAASGADALEIAMGAAPVGMWVNVLFLWTWRAVPPKIAGLGPLRQLAAVLLGSLVVWAAGAAAAVAALDRLRSAGAPPLAVGALAWAGGLATGAWACRHNPPAPPGRGRVGPGALAARGLLAALAIGAAVELAPRAGPTVAAMAAVFPAIFLTTMLSLWLSQGRAVQAGAVGPMMLGASSVGAYALLAAITMPRLGPAAGAALAWAGAVAGVTAPAAAWLRRRA